MWVAFDKQVLCFNAYFQEVVHEKREEKYRFRKCKIYFYLEDDTIQVIESKIENSGIPQGTLIRRHRIPLPPPNNDAFYTIENFNIGKEVMLYSRLFHITVSLYSFFYVSLFTNRKLCMIVLNGVIIFKKFYEKC